MLPGPAVGPKGQEVSTKKEIGCAFASCTRHMQMEDWAWLCRAEELAGNIYVVDASRRAQAPDPTTTPWTVLLLLGSHSRKHVFLGRKQLSMKMAWRAANSFANRIKLIWHFHSEEASSENMNHMPICRRDVRSYKDAVLEVVDVFCKNAKREVISTIVAANK